MLDSDPRLLCSVRGLVRAYVGGLGFSPERTEEVVLAVDEACSNAIRHSYQGRIDRPLRLHFDAHDGLVEIVLRDEGKPLRKERVTRRRLKPEKVARVRPGGLGVQLMYQVFDDVEFQPGLHRGNQVVMRLRQPRCGAGRQTRHA
ncbi:MAG: ATP-binding protein [Candidatus Hydrogenedentes bacterium]|nr:ATP-binding protein [Candidatus Hydrogenedentota bacterium]